MRKFFKSSTRSYFLNGIILLLLFLPFNLFGSIIQSIITIGILIFNSSLNFTKKLSPIKLGLLFCIICSFLYVGISQVNIHTHSILKIFNILLIISFFPLTDNFNISRKVVIGSLLFILLTQLSYMFKINFIVDFIDKYYTSEDYFSSYETLALEGGIGGFLNFRFGGIFRNPNQCGRVLTLLFAIFMVNKNKIYKQDYLVFGGFICAVLLTGSRTSLLIFSLLAAVYLIYIKKNTKILNYLIIPLLGISLTFFLDFDSRIFDFSELIGSGKQASVNAKYDFLAAYTQSTLDRGSYDFFFGTFTIDEARYIFPGVHLNRFDSEIGYLIHGLGIFATLFIFLFYLKIFLISNVKTRFIMILLIWAITSTVLTNFRFATLFMIVLSMYYYSPNFIEFKSAHPQVNK